MASRNFKTTCVQNSNDPELSVVKGNPGTNRTIQGFWWSPQKSDIRCFGTLNLNIEHGGMLEVFFDRSKSSEDIEPKNEVIHGTDERNNPITLLFTSSPSTSSLGLPTRRFFWAGYVLLGIHVPNADSFIANNLRFRIQQLYGWAGLSGFLSEPGSARVEAIIRYKHPDELKFSLNADLSMELGIASNVQTNIQDRSVDEEAWVSFLSASGLSFKKCLTLVTAMRHLLHFASLEPIYPTLMEAFATGHGYHLGNTWVEKEIEIYSSLVRVPKTLPPFKDEWIFRFEDVRDQFTGFMTVWLDYVEKYREALNCYSSTIYHRLPDTMIHLALTQGLDAYHGVRYSSHKSSDFKAKIEQLINQHAASLGIAAKDISDFAERVRTTRNYYTHHNPDKWATGLVAEKSPLYRMNEKLMLLFQMCVLSDIGISKERYHRLHRQLATTLMDFL